ncbi:centrosomal protein 89kDa [Nesidiocoris tenuis]|uniref:Centrosomal protein 89kDa n=1 Tax=Nesidiocoris tenuis TaxID=355587 RepID=A0ABN7BG72_9HEMI|nr:centrosomal protein 89kDa [Nesidiocoris tenuis]
MSKNVQTVPVEIHRDENSPAVPARTRRNAARKNVTIEEPAEKTRLKKNGKPSRRWLSREMESMRMELAEMAKKLKEKEANELRFAEIRARYENELAHWRSDRGPVPKERMKSLMQDVYLLKNLVVKLNKELLRYQDKLRSIPGAGPLDPETVSRDRSANWVDGELTILAPLLVAYEENVREKSRLVQEAKDDMAQMTSNIKDLVAENESLRQSITESQTKGDITYADWLALQKECAMFKEQNHLLMRQAKLHSTKYLSLKDNFQTKLDETATERDTALEKYNQAKTELSMLKGRFSVLSEEFDRVKNEEENKIPHSVHTAYITECKRLFEELKRRYEDEREILLRNQAEQESRTIEAEQELSRIRHERDLLRNNLESLGAQIKELRDATANIVKERDSLKVQLSEAVQFSKELIAQEEGLLLQLRQRTEESKFGSKLASRVENLKENMKTVEQDTLRQMEVLDTDLQMQVKSVGKIKETFSNEISRLRTLLEAKDSTIAQLKKENEAKAV